LHAKWRKTTLNPKGAKTLGFVMYKLGAQERNINLLKHNKGMPLAPLGRRKPAKLKKIRRLAQKTRTIPKGTTFSGGANLTPRKKPNQPG